MSWLARVKAKLTGKDRVLSDFKEVNKNWVIGEFAHSEHSMGFDIVYPPEDDAEGLYRLASLSVFRREDGGWDGSLLFLEYRQDLATYLNSVFVAANRLLESETRRPLTACDMAMQRAAPLAETEPLSGGLLTIEKKTSQRGEGRFLLRWISEKNFRAGRLDDAHHHTVAALDVVRDTADTAKNDQPVLHGHLAVFHRLSADDSDPRATAWAHFSEELGLPPLAKLEALEAMQLPRVSEMVIRSTP